MLRNFLSLVPLLFFLVSGCKQLHKPLSVASPDEKNTITFHLSETGEPYYKVMRNGEVLVNDSRLGLEFADYESLAGNLEIVNSSITTFDETWTQPWGETEKIRNHYNELVITLQEQAETARSFSIVFRAYDDGVAFRYEVPDFAQGKEYHITNELTEFELAHDFNAWWIPAYGEGMDYEALFSNDKLSSLTENIHTPLTLEQGDSLYVSVHEASLINYAGMTLKPSGKTLSCDLVPWSTGEKVRMTGDLTTPWRTLQIAENAGDLVTSYLILNLNEPSKLENTDWIEPAKYAGIWWGMHIKTQTWGSGPQHGATTENTKALIDFAAANNLKGVLAEGWNVGWDGDWSSGEFSFTEPYPDYDIAELSAYAASKGVGLVAHHETGGNVIHYESQLKDALEFLKAHNIHYLKTGYVCDKTNGKEYHQSQYMVNHYNKVMKMAAEYEVMLDVHEPVKATGLRRTYPNMMTREGVRGTEYEAWSEGNPPEHTVILPFTRGLAGPIDYTPGIFDITIKNQPDFRVHTTLAKQLALYVALYSPLHMAADLPEHYEGQPAVQFIRDVPTDWSETKVLSAKIGEHYTVARKDRNSEDWYIGSITNAEGRAIEVSLDFLTDGEKYEAQLYVDGENASMEENPLAITISTQEVSKNENLTIRLAPGGGAAIRFKKLSESI